MLLSGDGVAFCLVSLSVGGNFCLDFLAGGGLRPFTVCGRVVDGLLLDVDSVVGTGLEMYGKYLERKEMT